MPPGLLNTMTREEILDLLTWMEAGENDKNTKTQTPTTR
jgi:hypothetical protein